jgi:hypothetical protein
MAIADYLEAKKQKGMVGLTNLIKVGKTVADVATGNWVGAIANWAPDIAKSVGDAKGMFDKWKAGQRTPGYVDTSRSPGGGWWGR